MCANQRIVICLCKNLENYLGIMIVAFVACRVFFFFFYCFLRTLLYNSLLCFVTLLSSVLSLSQSFKRIKRWFISYNGWGPYRHISLYTDRINDNVSRSSNICVYHYQCLDLSTYICMDIYVHISHMIQTDWKTGNERRYHKEALYRRSFIDPTFMYFVRLIWKALS